MKLVRTAKNDEILVLQLDSKKPRQFRTVSA
jgi:hypothetical protein